MLSIKTGQVAMALAVDRTSLFSMRSYYGFLTFSSGQENNSFGAASSLHSTRNQLQALAQQPGFHCRRSGSADTGCIAQALVDHPDETRRVMNFKRLAITDLKVDIPRLASKKVLKQKLAESGEHLVATVMPRNFRARHVLCFVLGSFPGHAASRTKFLPRKQRAPTAGAEAQVVLLPYTSSAALE
jgi:hypothetical protein